jgi:thiol-disulfide isomerase/thioredoxin
MIPLLAAVLSFKVLGIDCASCGPPVVKALRSVPGVTRASVDVKTSIATVEVPDGFDPQKLEVALSNAGFAAELPNGSQKTIEPLPANVVKSLDITIHDGMSKIDVAKLLAPGKVTVVDFYGDWCVPCRALQVRLERYLQAHPNVALRRVNIGHWDNPAAVQAVREFHADALPYVRVYDGKGNFVRAVTGGMWDEVLAAIEAGAK